MNYKRILWLLPILLPAGAIIRIMQYYYAIDPVSGYYKQSDNTITYMYFFIGICFLVFSLPLLKRKKVIETLPKNNIFEILIFSITSAFYIAYAVVFVLPNMQISENIDLQTIFLFIFGILAAIFFGMNATFDERIFEKTIFKFLALTPIVFFLIRLVTVFIQLTMKANVSGYTLELIELASFVFFFMNYAKFTHSKSNVRSVYIFGLWSVLSVSIASVPSLIIPLLKGNLYREGQPIELETLYLLTGIFILCVVIKIGRLKNKKRLGQATSIQ